MSQKTDIIKRWRNLGTARWGRLYWRRNNMRWRDTFDSDDVCIVRDPPLTTHYKTLDALLEDIEYAEDWLKKKADEACLVPTD